VPPALLIFREKLRYDDGGVLEMTLWQVPDPVRASGHLFKYSLFYGEAGRRLVGYDNEPGKDDHRHCGDPEEGYTFTSPHQLVADFLADVG